MTIPDLILRLFSDKGVTPARLEKAKGLAARHKIEWTHVLAAMTPDQRAQVEA